MKSSWPPSAKLRRLSFTCFGRGNQFQTDGGEAAIVFLSALTISWFHDQRNSKLKFFSINFQTLQLYIPPKISGTWNLQEKAKETKKKGQQKHTWKSWSINFWSGFGFLEAHVQGGAVPDMELFQRDVKFEHAIVWGYPPPTSSEIIICSFV